MVPRVRFPPSQASERPQQRWNGEGRNEAVPLLRPEGYDGRRHSGERLVFRFSFPSASRIQRHKVWRSWWTEAGQRADETTVETPRPPFHQDKIMDGYDIFFGEIWSDDPPLYVTVFPPSVDMLGRPIKTEGVRVRVVEGLLRTEYAVERGVTLPANTRSLSILATELPETWRPVPGATLEYRGREWRIHQDFPAAPLSPDGAILRLTVHPA